MAGGLKTGYSIWTVHIYEVDNDIKKGGGASVVQVSVQAACFGGLTSISRL